MLTRLVAGGEQTNSVLLSVSSQDRLLARDIINLFLKSPQLSTVHTVLLTTGPSSVLGDLSVSQSLDLSDVLGWVSEGPPLAFPELVASSVDSSTQNVVIDNLTDLLIFFKHATVTQFIRKLRQNSGKKTKIFFVVHSDCIAAEILEDIGKFVTTSIKIVDIKSEKLCKIEHTKAGGRLVSTTEVISQDSDRNIKTLEYKESASGLVVDSEDDTDTVISSLTTFSLATKQTEKEVKDKLVLPFYKDSQTGAGQVKISGHSQQSGSKIYYEPDSGDDWDDEDPDDDLDF